MKKKTVLFIFILSLVLVTGLTASSAPRPALSPAEIKIGVILPLSGPLAPIGKSLKAGADLAADIVNTKYPGVDMTIAKWEGIPALGGAKLKLVYADSKADPGVTAEMTRRLIEDEKVVMVMGAYRSADTKTGSVEAERLGIPWVNPDSTSPALSKRGFKWFWRVTPHETWFTKDLFDFLEGLVAGKAPGVGRVPKKDIDTLAVAAENTEWGKAALEEIKKFAPGYGYKIVEEIVYPHKAVDLTSEVRRMIDSKAEVFLFAPYVADAILWIKTLKEMRASPRLIWGQNAGFIDPSFYKTLGADVNGIVARDLFSPELAAVKPVVGQINKLYREKTGVDFDGSSARDFVGVQVIAHVLNNARSTDPAALAKALDELYIPGKELIMPWEGIKFGSPLPGDTKQNELGSGVINQYQGFPEGKIHIVYPFASATTKKMIYPFPGWK